LTFEFLLLMIAFPHCKINLGLHITRKRPDGYHDLETIFYPLALRDALEAIRSESGKDVHFNSTGLPIAGDTSQNLCIKAYRLLQKDFPDLPGIDMHLHKQIPMGAGLGGGSADGAFALQLLDRLFQLGLTEEQLAVYALQLGSDCPFFMHKTPCFGSGRGEVLEPIAIDLSAYVFLIVAPGIHVSTAEAFAAITPQQPAVSLKEIISLPPAAWKGKLLNDFEAPVIEKHPVIGQVKEALYDAGAVYASMTGSGSCLYGLFPRHAAVPVPFPGGYPSWLVE
jgi:4-diphosphocytidyl-2-C-methyl-D-erythritol kinase